MAKSNNSLTNNWLNKKIENEELRNFIGGCMAFLFGVLIFGLMAAIVIVWLGFPVWVFTHDWHVSAFDKYLIGAGYILGTLVLVGAVAFAVDTGNNT